MIFHLYLRRRLRQALVRDFQDGDLLFKSAASRLRRELTPILKKASGQVIRRRVTTIAGLILVTASSSAFGGQLLGPQALGEDYCGPIGSSTPPPGPCRTSPDSGPQIGVLNLQSGQLPSYLHNAVVVASVPVQSSQFGLGLECSGSAMLVGSGASSAYLFRRGSVGWIQEQVITTPSSNASFGWIVALEGGTAMVGATGGSGSTFRGEVFVFSMDAGAWSETQALQASDGYLGDGFGRSIEISANMAFIAGDRIGAPAGAGAVYVFEFDGSLWQQRAKLKPVSLSGNAGFGSSIAHDGFKLLVGAWMDRPGPLATGSAYVFDGSGTAWTEQDKLIPGNARHLAMFGGSVALSGGDAIVGAYNQGNLNSSGTLVSTGSVYVFSESQGSWQESQEFQASDGAVNDGFGFDLAAAERELFVSSPGFSGGRGRIYEFDRMARSWVERRELTVRGLDPNDNLGRKLSLHGDRLAAGVQFDDSAGTDTGSVYVFEKSRGRVGASVKNRPSASNLENYQASKARIGLPWAASVDLSSSNYSSASVYGYLRPATSPQPGGQVLLVDLNSTSVFRLPLRASSGGQAKWSLRIPDIPSMAGMTVYTQAISFSPSIPYGLSNAQDLVVGY